MALKGIATSGLASPKSRQLFKEQDGRRAEKLFASRAEMIKKITPSATRTSWASLSSEEMSRVQALANITMNYQRPDNDLIEAMRKKQQHSANAATDDVLSTEPFPPSAADENTTLTKNAPPTHTSTASHNSIIPPKNLNKDSDWDWEDKARQIIEREQLSLDREWSRLSWKQKASNIVRLKLLKDDGYDVSPLIAKKHSSDQIIDALFAHVEARKQLSSFHITSGSERESDWNFGAGTGASSLGMRSSTTHGFSREPTNRASSISSVQSVDFSDTQPHLLTPEKRFYPTQPIIAQKRKHTHEDDLQPSWHESQPQIRLHALYQKSLASVQPQEPPCTCGASPPKLLRLLPPVIVAREIQEQAFHLLKRRLCRSLFHSSRAARTAFHYYSITLTCTALSVPNLVFTPRTAPKPSRIVFTEHAAPGKKPYGSDVYIGSRAFNLIKREVQCLSWSYDPQNSCYFIHDYDADDAVPSEGAAAAKNEQSFQHDIRMSSPGDDYMAVIEGEPRALISLMKYMRTNNLFHLGKWRVGDVREDAEGEGDVQMRVVVNEALPMQLSHGTDRVLEEIEMRLGERGDEGGDEVRVGVVQQCAKVRGI